MWEGVAMSDQTAMLMQKPPSPIPRYDVIYRNGPVLGIVYGVPAAAAPVRPLVPEGAETVAVLYVPGQR